MDHRVSKDMISKGMSVTGEKRTEDLGGSQYGSVATPGNLMDAYSSMYKAEEKVEEDAKYGYDSKGNSLNPKDKKKVKEEVEEKELSENPVQKAWNWFVPPPSKSANPNVRSGKLQPGKLEAGALKTMNKSAELVNKPIKATSGTIKAVRGAAEKVSGAIDTVSQTVNKAKTAVKPVTDAVGSAVKAAGPVATSAVGGGLSGALSAPEGKKVQGAIGGGSGAAVGAKLGSAGGPVGTAVGAAVGAAVGTAAGTVGGKKKVKEEVEENDFVKELIKSGKFSEQEIKRMSEAMEVTAADKKANTPAYKAYKAGKKNVKTGEPMYKAADHLKGV